MKKNECFGCKSKNDQKRTYLVLKTDSSQFGDDTKKNQKETLTLCNYCISDFSSGMDHLQKMSLAQNGTNKHKEELKIQNYIPKDIYKELNKHVIKQDEAKKVLSIAISQHYKKLNDKTMKKSNILLMGPSGSGKTELARVISDVLEVPFVETDSSNVTASGYVGKSADDMIKDLYLASGEDPALTEKGIIFLDEIDKLAAYGAQSQENSRVKSSDVQRELLKIIEGKVVTLKIPISQHEIKEVKIDTSKILFICAGAFVGLDEIVKKRLTPSSKIGLSKASSSRFNEETADDILSELKSEDLQRYGFIPELIGRLPIRTYTKKLTDEDLMQILEVPENSVVKEFTKLFSLDDVKINFSKEYLQKVVTQAQVEETGARGLRTILEKEVNNFYFDIELYRGKSIDM